MSNYDTRREVTGIVLFFCAVALTLMYYLPEVTGKAGEVMRVLGFGLIGRAAFMIPLFLFYASVDFFLEKRKGVAPVRVRSVIMLMVLVAAIFAASTMDFDYFKLVCTDSDGKAKAGRAIKYLWKSGYDKSLVKSPDDSSVLLTGGILGGGIATALNVIAGKVLSILAIIVFLLSQIILIFHVSLKQTARKTASMISNRAANRTRRYQAQGAGRRPVQHPEKRPGVTVTDYRDRQVQPQTQGQPARRGGRGNPVAAAGSILGYDPFNTKIPFDRKTGFIDVSDKAFGVNNGTEPGKLSYENRTVSTVPEEEASAADFSYTPTPKNPPLRPRRNEQGLSFLEKDTKADFYDLGDGSEHIPYIKAGTDIGITVNEAAIANDTPYIHEIEPEPEMPYEIDDGYNSVNDDPYDYSNRKPGVRKPEVSDAVTAVPEDDIPINAVDNSLEEQGFSRTDGRIIDTSGSEKRGPEITSSSARVPGEKKIVRRNANYRPVPTSLLPKGEPVSNPNNKPELKQKAEELQDTLKSFGINAEVKNITCGPAITRFELTIDKGVKVSRVLSLQDDIALAMAAVSVRIEAPIPGKSAIGIEIPNKKTTAVRLRGLVETPEFKNGPKLEVPLGRDIPGNPIMCDIAKMPHLLVAGSTGSGKSVCINTILTSILMKSTPDDVRMILIDPKVVELSIYNGIPHLLMPVVNNPKKAANALKWAVVEMERRYKLFADNLVRDLAGYNEMLVYNGEKPLPLILIVIDELADLMTVAAKEVEEYISRLAAMARAAGLHLLIATQRPSVDVITGTIKSNIPSRIAFAVASGVDSRTILDSNGAEKLLGKGDMLYAPQSAPKPIRGQGAFLKDEDVADVVKYLKQRYEPIYDEDIQRAVESGADIGGASGSASSGGASGDDQLFEDAVEVVLEAGSASVSILQRRLGIGYPRAGKLVDELEKKHIIGPFEGSKPRKVLITRTDWLEMKAKGQE